jgi:4-diphosphocytidyl-2-C-methyl-D-erythritol kinase
MVVFPNCKINLGLYVGNKRADGFHNLHTVFYPLPLYDALEVIAAPGNNTGLTFTGTGIGIDGNSADNICVKAYELLLKDFPQLPAVHMHLHKAIPLGAGLGGGSADGSFALQLLNTKFKLQLTQQQLAQFALQLGSDCPFFIINQPAYATGRGEVLTPLQLSLSGFYIAIINPGIHVNTGWAFSQLQNKSADDTALKEIIAQPVHTWQQQLHNDFEVPVFATYPAVKKIKADLYNMGAVYAAMSGSGSTVFGLFKEKISLEVFTSQQYFSTLLLLR